MLQAYDKQFVLSNQTIEEVKNTEDSPSNKPEAAEAKVAELAEKLRFANETIARLVDAQKAKYEPKRYVSD